MRPRLPGDDAGAVAVAHARPAVADGVLVREVGHPVQTHGRQFQQVGPFERPSVERFDVDQIVREPVARRGDLVVGERVKHERVVRVRAVPDADVLRFSAATAERMGESEKVSGRELVLEPQGDASA